MARFRNQVAFSDRVFDAILEWLERTRRRLRGIQRTQRLLGIEQALRTGARIDTVNRTPRFDRSRGIQKLRRI